MLSTWTNEEVNDISCEITQTNSPKIPSPHFSTVNFQIVGTQEGLKKIDADIILKCRSDQFIHNKQIFDIFEKFCPKDKIMIPNYGSYETIEFRASDFCQISTKSNLLEYWNTLQLFDGTYAVEAGTYMTKNYIKKVKKNTESWKNALRKYFFVRDFHDDFQIEWEKMIIKKDYQDLYKRAHGMRVKIIDGIE